MPKRDGLTRSDGILLYGVKKTLKWYKKIVIELICSTFIVNAWFIHRKWGNIKCRNVVLQRNYYRWFNKRC
jgi:hypothetical protein